MAKPDRFMPLEIEPWMKKTARLSAAARGAYLDLLLAYWRGEELPADDDDALMRIARCTEKEWMTVREKVLSYFFQEGATLRQKRADEEKAKAEHRYEQKATAGKAGGKQSGKQRRSKTEADNKQGDDLSPKQTATESEHISTLEHSPSGEVQATPGADAPLKARIFGPCLDWLGKQTKQNPNKLRSLVGKWCSTHGDGKTLEAISAAQIHAALDPIPYVQRVLDQKPGRDGSRTGSVVDTFARLTAAADLGGQDRSGGMGRAGDGLRHAEDDGSEQGEGFGGGATVVDADDAEGLFRASRRTETNDGAETGAGERHGSPTATVRAKAERIPSRRGEGSSHHAGEPVEVVAGMGGIGGKAGAADEQTQASAVSDSDQDPYGSRAFAQTQGADAAGVTSGDRQDHRAPQGATRKPINLATGSTDDFPDYPSDLPKRFPGDREKGEAA